MRENILKVSEGRGCVGSQMSTGEPGITPVVTSAKRKMCNLFSVQKAASG